MLLQYTIIIIVLALAVAYVCYRLFITIAKRDSECAGCEDCPIKEKCGKARGDIERLRGEK